MKPAPGRPRDPVGVVIYVKEGEEETSLTSEIIHGLEEEQLPYTIERVDFPSADAVEMAYQAATRSVFGVGICHAGNEIVLHYKRLPKEKPLFLMAKNRNNLNKARVLGANAARLIKGLPFERM